ncbi:MULTISPECIES: ABC transporter substrate-binding protein [unclassified Oceanispirochaeta]|uniref:ABC transporter substrate-binding protein n=1 Tax=unclassified Oceanispirochaeta TaxID=2635722 RepID=UPI000E093481|nr:MULTISPECIES: ABC transporter substrate-binding protein [unclassified Oceanispirochaeta]MBF9017436.1 ABC transporter substrate-binding protein [Oceanispirochaeta sp. M2]NPD74008.1 extracellular solute-binding protein [Oceanispirochaeta sp. M1]RDG30180.1 extracellular solute-binding protein [Oceanispirochaeta sp. M1]
MKKGTIAMMIFIALAIVSPVFSSGSKEIEEGGKQEKELTFLTVEAVYIEDYDTNDFTKHMEKRSDVKIDWETIPEQAMEEKLNLVLASGDYPDVFFGLSFTDDKLSLYGTEEQLLMPLNDLIDQHMPNLKKVLDSIPGAWGAITSPDGKIYGLPSFNICYHCENANKMWVYKPWLDTLGLEMPRTTEEYEEMLIAFRDQDPNGNGKNDEIPYAAAIKAWHATADLFLLNSFVYTDIDSRIDVSPERYIGFYVDKGEVKTSVDTDGYRDGLRYLNKLYSQGLIFPGSFTQDGSQLVQLVEGSDEPVVGVTTGGWGGVFSDFGGERYSNFRPLEPLEGPNGVQYTPTYLSAPIPGSFVIAASCEYPVEAVQWVDYLYSTEGTLHARNGLEGVNWRWAVDGELGLDGEPAIWKQLIPWNDTDPQNESFLEVGPRAMTSEFRLGQVTEQDLDMYGQDGIEKMLFESTKDLYKPHADASMALPRLKFLSDEVSEFATIRTEYAKYVKQSLIQFIVGDLDIESDWDTYITNLNKLDQADLLEVSQKAYDRQFK